ncbi:MAG: hypothetical protein AAF418_05525 [Pseudomonadota bacterium]
MLYHPMRALIRMAVILAVLLAGTGFLAQHLIVFFMTNTIINGIILGVLVLGLLHAFRIIILLLREWKWMSMMRSMLTDSDPGLDLKPVQATRFCALLARTMDQQWQKHGKVRLSSKMVRTFIDGVEGRMEEVRELGRYMVGLLVFLGLLGTFWGLLGTLDGVSSLIAGMQIVSDDLATTFDYLKVGMQQPISAMGTAFGTSLFGLAGSLVLGFFQLQASQAMSRFSNNLEEWLSGISHHDSTMDGAAVQGFYLESMLEQIAERIEKLTTLLSNQASSSDQEASAHHIARLVELGHATNVGQEQIVTQLSEIGPALRAITRPEGQAALRGSLGNIEQSLHQLIQRIEKTNGWQTEILQQELRLIAKTIGNATNRSRTSLHASAEPIPSQDRPGGGADNQGTQP